MKYKKLGKTKIDIPIIGQGCMGIGGYLSRDMVHDEQSVKALRRGIELGMTFIDTAEVYGNGHSEELVAIATDGIRDKVFISTKVSPENLSYNDVIKSAKDSLKRLKTDYIDLYQIHWPNPRIPICETMQAMEQLADSGKIRYIGVSNFSLKELKSTEKCTSGNRNPIMSIQVEYNLFDRTIEDTILPYCKQNDITIIAYSPLDQGRIANGKEKMKKLENVSRRYNKTISQITLNWLTTHPTVIAIPKAINISHIEENAFAADFDLSEGDFREIDKVFSIETSHIQTDRIRVITDGQGNRQVYQNVYEAVENKLGFVPSPKDLASDILNGEDLKPVRVMRSKDMTGTYDYDLIEGRIRYWAWVIAYRGKKPIPAYIRNI